jgi:hypothetical protein
MTGILARVWGDSAANGSLPVEFAERIYWVGAGAGREEADVNARMPRTGHTALTYASNCGHLDGALLYAISIHKSHGSEFPAVIVPVSMQHYMLLQRNLIYTAITRGRKMVVLIGQKKALGVAVRNNRTGERFSGLLERLRGA